MEPFPKQEISYSCSYIAPSSDGSKLLPDGSAYPIPQYSLIY